MLSVMISRARHGVVLLRAGAVESLTGTVWQKEPSSFLASFEGIAQCRDQQGVTEWLTSVDWSKPQRGLEPAGAALPR